jgi:hypothetical protein
MVQAADSLAADDLGVAVRLGGGNPLRRRALAEPERGQNRRSATQKNPSANRILGRGRLALRTASCWRRARFSIKR